MRYSEMNQIFNDAMFGYVAPPLKTAGTVVLVIPYWYHSIVGCVIWLVNKWFCIIGFAIICGYWLW